ncbi:MAG: iron response transcriptional regulator IrrA [Methyloligellaceae bacterium]
MSETYHIDELKQILKDAGLRPTRQRLELGDLLFAKGDRHVTAEQLHEEAVNQEMSVSLATVYNTLHQFTEAGLLRQVAINGSKTYFDTNTSNHSHFYHEQNGKLIDIPGEDVEISGLPEAPEGMKIARVDIVVHLAKK